MTTESAPTKKRASLKKLSELLTLIVAVAALLMGARLFYLQIQQQNIIKMLEAHINQQQEQLANTNKTVATQTQQIAALHKTVSEIADKLNQDKQSDVLRRYRLGNIEYFIRLANQTVLLEHDAPKAQRLLESADAEIAQANEPVLHDVHEQITKDIAALKAVPVVDVDDLFTQLNALIEQTDTLPVTPSLKFSPSNNEETVVAPSTLGNVMAWLSQYIKIQKHENVATPLLTPQEASFVKHNIVVLLEQAQWGVLRQESHAYKASLTNVEKLVGQYGVKEDSAVKSFLDSVNKLKSTDIAPTLPDISASLPLLEKITAPESQSDMP